MRSRKPSLAPLLALATALGLAACAAPPRPSVMADAEQMRATPAATEASTLSPAAFAHAESLRGLAEEAYQAKDYVGAQLLSERAIAAYHHAHALARTVRAETTKEAADHQAREAKERLAETEAELARILEGIELLEKRIMVARDALPITPSSPASSAKRELARLASSRALALDARLLCAAAKLLDAKTEGLEEAERALEDLGALLEAKQPAPIDEASRARARCLESLTRARRKADAVSSVGRADELLATLSARRAFEPLRDDRGVVVSLRDLFRGDALSKEGASTLQGLGKLAAEHPGFPLQVVVHGEAPRERASQRGAEVAKALVAAGVATESIHVEAAGTSRPIADPSVAKSRARNERVEIVFVDPGG